MTSHPPAFRSRRITAMTILLAALAAAASIVVVDGQGGGGGRQGGVGPARQGGPAVPGGAGGRGQGRGRGEADGAAIGTSVISGTVVSESGGSPVRRARVTLTGTELRGGRSVITDDAGQFTFLSLPAGRFTMTASKSGYVDNAYGARRAGRPGTPIQLGEGQKMERATIMLPRGGVITGIVLDDHGEPSAGTQVRVLRFVSRTGEKTLQVAGTDSTDDRGVYRIFQLQPGEYIVNAIPRNQNSGDIRQVLASEVTTLVSRLNESGIGAGRGLGDGSALTAIAQARGGEIANRVADLQAQLAQAEQEQPVAYAPVYYPGTTSASAASTITIGVSEERSGVDFRLQLVPTSRVSGTVVSSAAGGIVPQNTQIALVPADQAGSAAIRGLGVTMTRANAMGQFSFSNVTPGTYTIQARSNVRDAAAEAAAFAPGANNQGGRRGGGPGAIVQILWASTNVSVAGQDVSDVALSLQTGMTVSGRIDFRGAAAPPGNLNRVRVSLVPRGSETFADLGSVASVQADDTGRFNINGVPPGTYSLNAQLTAGGPNTPAGAARLGGPNGALGQGGPGGRAAGAGGAGGQWTLASAVALGRDVLDFPLEVGAGSGRRWRHADIHGSIAGAVGHHPGCVRAADVGVHDHRLPRRHALLGAAGQAHRLVSARHDRTVLVPHAAAWRLSDDRGD